MNVFDLNHRVLEHYKSFSRSFTSINADDLRSAVDSAYAEHRYTPDPLLSMNPRYKAGDSTMALARSGFLESGTAAIFSLRGAALKLHTHQQQALMKASAGESFVVTTGTGSGKSLCFFIPIINEAVRARVWRRPAHTRHYRLSNECSGE